MRTLILTAAVSATLTTLSLVALGWAPQAHSPGDAKLETRGSEFPKSTMLPNSGDVIWHNKGEDAPVLTNLGTKPYRTLVIEVK